MDAVTEVKDVAFTLTKTSKDRRHFFFNTWTRRIEHGRVHVALQRNLMAHAAARIGNIGGPVKAQRITAGFGHRFQPLSAAFGKQRHRHTAAIIFSQQTINDFMHVVQRELLIITPRQHAAPGIENHHRLRASFNLGVQVQRDAFGQLIQQQMQRLRIGIHHLFNHGKGFTAAAFHHVGRQRPRATGEANQWDFAFELTANGTHRIHDVAQLAFRIRNRQLFDIGFAGNWRGKAWAFPGFEIEPQPHRIGDGQDIREQDRRIKRVATQRLQRHFTSQLGVFAQRHKVASLRAGGFVLRQIAACLAHHPHRSHINGLAQQRTQITIVLEFGHFTFL